ncbi:2Fe-2S iron-sulfur cluster-binding protein [Marinobacter zhejiangensis]|uniref:Toluene monooxygenase electron transfer component n=1 Tax=Marinobacter zhejiangensis TaxID=488535 RepID=A0A1I4PH45_9GAMM|nr:2Fe-2S iron-sulfur cluster binding domain-containing protein [Marinobacter zhejiangensis]SFM27007.1 toluene monooxygenase electron transfer component [Marinobacter zhejiangensis]
MAIVKVHTGEEFECGDNETIARAALRSGLGFPYECNSGSCGTCKFTTLDGEFENLYPEAPAITERDTRKNRLLGCQCTPIGDVEIKVMLSDEYIPKYSPSEQAANLISINPITHDISAFSFKVEKTKEFIPGQYSILTIPGLGKRAYSMSNLPKDGVLEFMIKNMKNGGVSDYLFSERALSHGDAIALDGPYGIAHYRYNERDKICIAGGSGLAPMLSIAREHISSNQESRLHFLFGGKTDADLLPLDEFRNLVGDRKGLIEYYPVASVYSESSYTITGFLHDVLLSLFKENLGSYDIYCAGPPVMTASLEKSLFESGFPQEQLIFDRYC